MKLFVNYPLESSSFCRESSFHLLSVEVSLHCYLILELSSYNLILSSLARYNDALFNKVTQAVGYLVQLQNFCRSLYGISVKLTLYQVEMAFISSSLHQHMGSNLEPSSRSASRFTPD